MPADCRHVADNADDADATSCRHAAILSASDAMMPLSAIRRRCRDDDYVYAAAAIPVMLPMLLIVNEIASLICPMSFVHDYFMTCRAVTPYTPPYAARRR